MEFAPVLFSLTSISSNDDGQTLSKIVDAVTEVTEVTNSGYAFDFQAVAFVNQHPEMPEIILEIQAHSEDARIQGMETISAIVFHTTGLNLEWKDVTAQALEFHSKAKEEQDKE